MEDVMEEKRLEKDREMVETVLETLKVVLGNFMDDALANLLTPIYSYIQMCEDGDNIAEIKSYLRFARRDLEKILSGINIYRKFSRGGTLEKKVGPVDIRSIISNILLQQSLKTYEGEEFSIYSTKARLIFNYSNQKGALGMSELPFVLGGPISVETALQETLINAVESYDSGKRGYVTLSARLEDHSLTLEIADNGRGMNKEDRDKSQLPFFKVPGVKRSGRLGLGAYVALESAKYCLGDIHIESTEGLGTTASILFHV